MFKTIQKNSHPNHHRQKFSANVKSFGKLVLLTATSVFGLGYVGKYLTNQLNALKSSNNDGEGMLGQEDHYKTRYVPIRSVSFNTGRKLLSIDDLVINIKTISYSNPAVATLLNENIVVAWSDNYSGQIYCQIYTKNGIKVGSELQVSSDNSLYARRNPVIKVLSNGNFVIGWESSIQLRSGVVSTRLFTTTGEAISGENQIKTYSYIYDPLSQSGISSITDLSNGNFIVVWQDAYADLHAQIYTNTGAVANTFNIESFSGASDEGEANVVKLNNGNLVITCNVYTTSSKGSIREVYSVFYSIYTDTGGKVNSYLSYLNAGSYFGRPEVAALSNSNFVIASTIYDANGYKVLTQIYTQTGVKIATIKSNTYTSEWTPIAVSSLNNDNFVVMWYNNSKPCVRIYAQIYTNVGIAVNSEFLVSMYYDTFKGFYTTGSATFNFKPSISAYYANNFIVAWSTIDGIYAQMFSSVNYAMNYSASINLTCSPMVSSMMSPSTRVLAPSFSPYMPYSSPTREYSSTSPSSSPLAPSDKDYKSSACMNKPLLISFIQSTKTNTKELLNYAAKRIVNVWLDDEEKDNDKTIINKFSKLKI